MTPHWFLPETPDVLSMLREQAQITREGLDALVAWSGGDPSAAERIRECEHRGDERKRELQVVLTEAFSTPLDAEDIFELSRGIDEILNQAKNLVGEAEAMDMPPNESMAEMARHLAAGVGLIVDATESMAGDKSAATSIADAAIKEQRHLQHSYRRAMSDLVEDDDLREVTALRELYRRLARTGDELVRVAERIWYSTLKER
jgi:uncharacterized protein